MKHITKKSQCTINMKTPELSENEVIERMVELVNA